MSTLKIIQQPGFYDKLGGQTRKLMDGLTAAAKDAGVAFSSDAVGGMFGIYFSEHVPENYAQIKAGNKERFNQFFHAMLDAGVYLAPSAFEAGFVSAMHSDAVIDETLSAARGSFAKLTA